MDTQEQQKITEFAHPVFGFILDVLEIFAFSVLIVFAVFTFICRPCQVDGSSMNTTLEDKDVLLSTNFAYTPKQGDIIIFQMNNPDAGLQKVLVKRVIAVGGQTVKIDFNTNVIMVDGVVYDDSHAYYDKNLYTIKPDYNYDSTTGVFETVVPVDSVFVLGDNRNNSRDSRSSAVGFVSEDIILGRVALRFKPFTLLTEE